MSNTFGLSKMQCEVFKFIRSSIEETGICPSYDEIARHINRRSRSGVHATINRLIERGYIRRLPGFSRSLEIIDHTVNPLQKKFDDLSVAAANVCLRWGDPNVVIYVRTLQETLEKLGCLTSHKL